MQLVVDWAVMRPAMMRPIRLDTQTLATLVDDVSFLVAKFT